MKKFNSQGSRYLKSFAVIGATVSLVVGCQKVELIEEPLQDPQQPSAFILSQQQAEQIALQSVGLIPEEAQTRSNARTVKKSSVVHNAATRSVSGSDTLFYVVNFENEAGYAIIAADKRTESLVAVSGEGNFDWEEAENSDARFVTQSLTNYQHGSIDLIPNPSPDPPTGPIIRPPVTDIIYPKPGPISEFEYSELYTVHRQSLPYLVKTNWTQHYPYSAYTAPTYPTGCTVTAAAQVMAYLGYPKSFNGYYFDWDHLFISYPDNESTKKFVQMVFEQMPGKTLVNWFGKKSIAIYLHYVPECLYNLGYKGTGEHCNYNTERMVSSIRNGSPVCVQGNVRGDLTNAHTWIMDGILVKAQDVREYIMFNGKKNYVNSRTFYSRYFHCNWGWGKYYNGYYAEGVFNSDNKSFGNDELGAQKSGGSNDYRANLRMIINIKP